MTKRYRKRGLDRPARRMLEFLESRSLDGATVLEVSRKLRAFAHPPPAMLAVLQQHALRPPFVHRGIPRHVAGLEREVTS